MSKRNTGYKRHNSSLMVWKDQAKLDEVKAGLDAEMTKALLEAEVPDDLRKTLAKLDIHVPEKKS